jgi:hydrogenase maturation protease
VEAVGAPGLGLANWLEGCSKVILVDAARMGRAPGAWRRFAPEEVRLIAAGDVVSLHQAGVAEGLALAQALHLLPEEVVIYGLEPARCDERPELSPDVRQALPELVEAILAELRNPGGRASKARRA